MARPPIDAALLPELLDYDPETGVLTWKERGPEWFKSDARAKAWNAQYAGKPAFTSAHNAGYWHGAILRRSYLAHRVCWAIATGSWPSVDLDHINGNRADNRITNLREASAAENGQNKAASRGATSSYVGVSWHTLSSKWRAQIKIKGRSLFIGLFDTEEEAFAAYCAAKAEHHTFNPVPREAQDLEIYG